MTLEELRGLEPGTILRWGSLYAVTNGDKAITLEEGEVVMNDFSVLLREGLMPGDLPLEEVGTGSCGKDEVLRRAKKSRVQKNISWTCDHDWVEYLLHGRRTYLYKVYSRSVDATARQPSFTYQDADMGEVYRDITASRPYHEGLDPLATAFSRTRRPEPGDDIGYFLAQDPRLASIPEWSHVASASAGFYAMIFRSSAPSSAVRRCFEEQGGEIFCPTVPCLRRGIYMGDGSVLTIGMEDFHQRRYSLRREPLLDFLTVSAAGEPRRLAARCFILDHGSDAQREELARTLGAGGEAVARRLL
ncbi:MAG: hypothetical protein K6A65_05255, partial [Succinivibrionaceae bacterium]|nr:hypothetical protein [Succinivibrionaceae bacterium]